MTANEHPNGTGGAGRPLSTERSVRGYFTDRWQARVPFRTLFWRDMWAIGSVANLFAGFLSLMAVAQRWGDGWTLAAHFALLPYNLFLVAAVWRSPASSDVSKAAAVVWLGLTLLL